MQHSRNTIGGVLFTLLLLGSAASGEAQGGPPGGPPGPPDGRGRPGAGRVNEAQRAQIERRLQERINQVVRQRLALTDDQFAKLREVATKVEDERRALRNDEMSTRFAMRQELLAEEKVNEARVAELLDRMPKLERRRLDLMEGEQRDLARFLSPSQRARYMGLQDELRRSMQDLQRRRMDMDSTPMRPGAARRLRPPPGGF